MQVVVHWVVLLLSYRGENWKVVMIFLNNFLIITTDYLCSPPFSCNQFALWSSPSAAPCFRLQSIFTGRYLPVSWLCYRTVACKLTSEVAVSNFHQVRNILVFKEKTFCSHHRMKLFVTSLLSSVAVNWYPIWISDIWNQNFLTIFSCKGQFWFEIYILYASHICFLLGSFHFCTPCTIDITITACSNYFPVVFPYPSPS